MFFFKRGKSLSLTIQNVHFKEPNFKVHTFTKKNFGCSSKYTCKQYINEIELELQELLALHIDISIHIRKSLEVKPVVYEHYTL